MFGFFKKEKKKKEEPERCQADDPLALTTSNVGLPAETLYQIFSYLSPKELLQASAVNTSWRQVASDNHLWKKLYLAKESALSQQLQQQQAEGGEDLSPARLSRRSRDHPQYPKWSAHFFDDQNWKQLYLYQLLDEREQRVYSQYDFKIPRPSLFFYTHHRHYLACSQRNSLFVLREHRGQGRGTSQRLVCSKEEESLLAAVHKAEEEEKKRQEEEEEEAISSALAYRLEYSNPWKFRPQPTPPFRPYHPSSVASPNQKEASPSSSASVSATQSKTPNTRHYRHLSFFNPMNYVRLAHCFWLQPHWFWFYLIATNKKDTRAAPQAIRILYLLSAIFYSLSLFPFVLLFLFTLLAPPGQSFPSNGESSFLLIFATINAVEAPFAVFVSLFTCIYDRKFLSAHKRLRPYRNWALRPQFLRASLPLVGAVMGLSFMTLLPEITVAFLIYLTLWIGIVVSFGCDTNRPWALALYFGGMFLAALWQPWIFAFIYCSVIPIYITVSTDQFLRRAGILFAQQKNRLQKRRDAALAPGEEELSFEERMASGRRSKADLAWYKYTQDVSRLHTVCSIPVVYLLANLIPCYGLILLHGLRALLPSSS
ncbi:F-box/LRR-repeat protein 5 [Balamuthia mandrillaris]